MAQHEPTAATASSSHHFQSSGGTVQPGVQQTLSLASLSRNTSVISSSSSSSSTSSLVAPIRPRPLRTFSQSPPPNGRRARSPNTPTTPRPPRAPSYLTHQLGLGMPVSGLSATDTVLGTVGASTMLPPTSSDQLRSATISSGSAPLLATRPQPMRTNTSSAIKGKYSPEDFDFGEPLGEGSYSTVSWQFPSDAALHTALLRLSGASSPAS